MLQEEQQKQREKQMAEFFERIKSEFEVPEFFEHKIRYVENKNDACNFVKVLTIVVPTSIKY